MDRWATIAVLVVAFLASGPTGAAGAEEPADAPRTEATATADDPAETVGEPAEELPYFDPNGEPYRTPRMGESFRTTVFGQEVDVPGRDLRSISAWNLGLAAVAPGVTGSEVLPTAALYLWRHPDENTLFRMVGIGFYDEVFFAKSTDSLGPWEGVLTFFNYTLPVEQTYLIDGDPIEDEELLWGELNLGLGVGYRTALDSPGYDHNVYDKNMFALVFTVEPGLFYAAEKGRTADDFVVPDDTFVLEQHLRTRYDQLELNLLSLPHRGFAFGADAAYGWRAKWGDWGRGGSERGGPARDYFNFRSYILTASGVPFIDSDRHRMIWTVHGGTGANLDRFSSHRLGGGPAGHGEEYDSLLRPIVPGAAIDEFVTSDYAVVTAEYRWEPIFFAYVGLRATFAYVNRERFTSSGRDHRDDYLFGIGPRLTTGFLFETRLQLEYTYNSGVIRRDRFGGHEILVQIAGDF